MTKNWTADEFFNATGHLPQQDDLERCNCPDAGKPGHTACGTCEHGLPVFMCSPCFTVQCAPTMTDDMAAEFLANTSE